MNFVHKLDTLSPVICKHFNLRVADNLQRRHYLKFSIVFLNIMKATEQLSENGKIYRKQYFHLIDFSYLV